MDLVALWKVKLRDGVHKVEFEHGTTTGKRLIRVDGKEILKTDWMFRLVGEEEFKIGSDKCVISIEPADGFAYTYQLSVNGKPLDKFSENQSKILRSWCVSFDGNNYRITMEKVTLDVYVNGQLTETAYEFVENGSESHFAVGNKSAVIRASSSGKRRDGVQHDLYIEGVPIPEAKD